jgi:hypothetical protein
VQITWIGTDDVAGYVVHWGTSSLEYSHHLDVQRPPLDADGAVTVVISLEPSAATTYYFAVTSYDAAHLESTYSNELSVDVSS